MIADAYRYADSGGDLPKEVLLAGYIDRFGVSAVYGRVLGAGEIRRITASENVIKAYRGRAKSDNWADWAKQNPELNRILEYGLRLQDGE